MRRAVTILLGALLLGAVVAAPASASFGLHGLDFKMTKADGSPAVQAGSHPFAVTTDLSANTTIDPHLGEIPDQAIKDLKIDLPPGLAGNPTATPRCSGAEFVDIDTTSLPACANSTAIGIANVKLGTGPGTNAPVYNLVPAPGVAASIGFVTLGVPIKVDLGLSGSYPYNVVATLANVPQPVTFYSSTVTVWGNPSSPVHDPDRGRCAVVSGECSVSIPEKPFLTLPTSCSGPLPTTFRARSWQNPTPPGGWAFEETILTHDDSEPPSPLGLSGCPDLGFAPLISAQPTSQSAESPSGLDFALNVADEGLGNPTGTARSAIKKAIVTLPEGVTINPSQAEGLEACSEVDLSRETASSQAGDGCPNASKIGTIEVETPLLEGELLKGSLFVATPFENPFHTLIAFYIVIRDPGLGVIVKVPAKVEPDPRTGQLITTTDQMPQLPFSHFRLHFREGGRSPLITPALCGKYTTTAQFFPWANPSTPYTTTSSFDVSSGVGGGPCAAGGTPPFRPGFSAGTINNSAGSYSSFVMRLTRRDGDQDLTKFSADLPPGMAARLAGTSQCPASAIAAAKAKSGKAEQVSPSCPASSIIGHVVAGAGVGSELLYAPGTLYLAGPLNGAPLSVVAIVPAVAGPFDVGDVVTQVALRIDPRTAKVRADGSASDPIPHILAGIPLKVRDIRVNVDKPDFTLNPTSCDPFAVGAEIWGGGNDVFSSADDSPVSLAERFQASNCASLGFRPRLSLKLKGGTRRGGHPALTSEYLPRPGDANLANLVLRLPHSAFLDQAHIRTICTRVQFAAKTCPPGAVYGHAVAFTPLLAEPLQGPVYLRSSNHNLPDLVASLHGIVDVEAVGRIDSAHGGIRATFEEVPDAPISKVEIQMQGGKKGLIVNSTGLCAAKHRALGELTAHNAKEETIRPLLKPSCGGQGAKKKLHVAHVR